MKVRQPRVSYRETIRDRVKVVGECVKQAGTTGLFAKVTVDFQNHKGDQPLIVQNKIKPDITIENEK